MLWFWNSTGLKWLQHMHKSGKRYSVKYLKHMFFVYVSCKYLRKVNNLYLYTIVTMNALLCYNKNVFISTSKILEEIIMLITRRLSCSILNFSALQLTMQRAAVSTWWIKQFQNGRNTGSSETRQIVFFFRAKQKMFSLSEKQLKKLNHFISCVYIWWDLLTFSFKLMKIVNSKFKSICGLNLQGKGSFKKLLKNYCGW